jgi:hypothetical protein
MSKKKHLQRTMWRLLGFLCDTLVLRQTCVHNSQTTWQSHPLQDPGTNISFDGLMYSIFEGSRTIECVPTIGWVCPRYVHLVQAGPIIQAILPAS